MLSRLSLKYRIALVIFALEGFMVSMVLWQTISYTLTSNQELLKANENVSLNLLRDISLNALITENYNELQSYITEFSKYPNVHQIIIIERGGVVLGATDATLLGSIIAEFPEAENRHWRVVEIGGPASDGGRIALQFSSARLMETTADARNLGIGLALTGMVLIALFGVLAGILLTRRLERVTAVTRRFAGGDHSVRTGFSGNDELGSMGRAFDVMADRIAREFEERKRIEAQQRLQAQIIEQTHESILTTDATGLITSWNLGAERMFGYTAKETIGRVKAAELYSAEQQMFLQQRVVAPAMEKGHITIEVILKKKTGEEFHGLLSLTILKNDRGEVTGRIGHTLDITERKRIEEAVKTSEEMLRSFMDNSPSTIFLKDLEGRYLMVNRWCEEERGKTAEEMIGKTVTDFYPSEYATRFSSQESEVLKTGKPVEWEMDMPRNDGSVIRVINNKFPVYNPDGGMIGIGTISTDITGRKNAEEALRKNERLLRLVFDTIPHNLVVKDAQCRYQMVNAAFAEFHGYSVTELIDKQFAELPLLNQSNLDLVLESDRQVLESGKPVEVPDLHLTRIDGQDTIHYMHKLPIHDDREKIIGILALSMDITERKEAEDALRESEMQIRLITDSVPAMIAYIDAEKRYRYINRHYQEGVRLESGKIIGKTMRQVMGAQAFNQVNPQVDQVLSGTQVSYESEITHESLGVRHARASYVPHIDQEGTTLGFYALIYDITEQKRAENALMRWNETLEQRVAERTAALESAQEELVWKEKMATLGQLTATVSHELRNPLGTIRTSVFSIIEKTSPDTLGIGQSLARIDRNVTRCDGIISDLLDFTRNRSPKPLPTDVDEWIAEMMKEQIVPDWLELKLNLAVENRPVELDQEYIRRAVINLYENSRQALETRQDGFNGKKPKITIGARIERKWLKISVKDTGPGMTQGVLDKIFEPLFSTKTYGIGLGLPTVRQIIELNGGSISIKSQLGKGTQAVLKLPLNPSPPKDRGPSAT